VKLSLLEFNLLKYLLKHRNKLRTRRQILTAVWKDPSASERLLDPHMMIIRRKLEGFDHEIAAIYGGGYILRPRDSATPS
jgi:DNA-binding response OmpR family regulator